MPSYGLFLVGLQKETSNKYVVGWTDTPLNNEVFLVSGPYKMMALYTRVLLTKKGTVIGRPLEGTDFPDLVGGLIGDPEEFQDQVIIELDDAFLQTQDIQRKASLNYDIESKELLSSYNLKEFSVTDTGESSTIIVELTNAEGFTVQTNVPM